MPFVIAFILIITQLKIGMSEPEPPTPAFVCPEPELGGGPWDDKLGASTIKRAKETCRREYNGCLVKLVRKDLHFIAICRRNK